MPVRWEEGPEAPGLRKDALLGLEDDARRDNSASSGMITSTKTELQIPQ